MPCNFAYDVKDNYSYVDMDHSESSDSKVVTGTYLHLPPRRYLHRDNGIFSDFNGPLGCFLIFTLAYICRK